MASSTKADRENMQTATVASELLHFAFMKGDITDTVYDLGCGSVFLLLALNSSCRKGYRFDDDKEV